MKKLTDEEIDSLFKEAAANYEPAYHPSDWEVMNKKLEGKPFRIPMWVIIAGIGSIVFLAGIGVGVWMNDQPTLNSQLPNEEHSSLIVKSDTVSSQQKYDQVQSNTPIAAQPSDHQVVSSSNEQPLQNEPKKTILSSSTSVSQVSNYKSVKAVSNNRNEKESIAQPSQSPPKLNDLESPSLAKQPVENASISALESVSQQHEKQFSETLKTVIKLDSTLVLPKEVSKADSSVVNDLKAEPKKSTIDGKWFVKVMASPDNSAINFSSSAFAGYNISALFEYQLSNRWSLSSGVIISNKKYVTNEALVYSGKKVNGLDGTCQVIDIPIMVYYRIPTSSRFSFYSGVGFSSYLMLSENYKYSTVSNSSYSSTTRTWDTKVEGKNNEWFKLINVSLGVNYQLNGRWSLLAEPFAKLPMAGVGEGKVMLSSTGLFLGIKYKIH
ncbi:MAG: outer membrane beta-barrel protein [Cyclobacteriaceae bacterium]|jgi:outer membrane protein W|nr:outer membrane beta-barrel protein [Flammeovirgaceae bacterium]